MIQKIKEMLGLSFQVDYNHLVKNGALILEVRSKGEYASDHILEANGFSDTYNGGAWVGLQNKIK